jgi:hypothetical protein
MKRYIVFTLLIFSISLRSQIVIKDASSGDPLPYAIILGDSTGIYTDDKGYFNSGAVNARMVTIRFLGYRDTIVDLKNYNKQIIELQPLRYELPDVFVGNDKPSLQLKMPKKPRDFSWFPFLPGNEIIITVKPKEDVNYRLKSIKLPFSRAMKRDRLKKNDTAIVRFNFYRAGGQLIEQTNPVKIVTDTKDVLFVDLEDKDIAFDSSGIRIGLEFIGMSNSINNEDHNHFLLPQVTDRPYSGFDTETVIKFVKGKAQEKTIEEILAMGGHLGQKRNLRIELNLQ